MLKYMGYLTKKNLPLKPNLRKRPKRRNEVELNEQGNLVLLDEDYDKIADLLNKPTETPQEPVEPLRAAKEPEPRPTPSKELKEPQKGSERLTEASKEEPTVSISKKIESRLERLEKQLEEQKSMYKFSEKSKEKLSSCHPDLQRVLEAALKVSAIDFGISEGHRNKKDQDEAYRTGKSKVQYPNSKHNSTPSMAADVYAYVPSEGGVTWKLKYYYYLSGVIFTVAKQLGIKLRWGGDFNQNGNYSDDSFLDLVHWELSE